MSQPTDSNLLLEVDQYIERLFTPSDAALFQCLKDSDAGGLPEINVSPNEGKLLYLLAKITGARRILELGLLGGYSTIWLARALPEDGRLVSLEIDETSIQVARKNLERAGVLSRVDIRHGPALETLEKMVKSRESAFDLIFIDADKANYPAYLDSCLRMTRPGSVILADNVIRNGAVARDGETEPMVVAIQEFNRKLAAHPKLEAILVPLMRHSLDGLAIVRVK